MPRFNSINFYQNMSKIKLFLQQKIQNFQTLGAPPPNTQLAAAAGTPPKPL